MMSAPPQGENRVQRKPVRTETSWRSQGLVGSGAPFSLMMWLILFLFLTSIAEAAEGRFIGTFVLKDDLSDNQGRNMILVEPFGYIDPNGVRWQAEKGMATNGASIPWPLWSIVGSPFTGLYRRAAVIHDFYCSPEYRYRDWRKVHRMFYDAMITGGVDELAAKLMYYAVWRFGPRWDVKAILSCIPDPGAGRFCADSQITEAVLTSRSAIVDQSNKAEIEVELRSIEARLKSESIAPADLVAIATSHPSVKSISTSTRFNLSTKEGVRFLNNLEDYEISK